MGSEMCIRDRCCPHLRAVKGRLRLCARAIGSGVVYNQVQLRACPSSRPRMDSILPPEDKASTNGFSPRAVLEVLKSRGDAINIDGAFARTHAGAIRASNKTFIVCEDDCFKTYVPMSTRRTWLVTRAANVPEPPFSSYLISDAATQVMIIGLSSADSLITYNQKAL